MRWLSELRVALVLVVAATVIPLLWARHDSARRLALKQQAFASCLVHSHHADRCVELRPATLAPSTGALCELRWTAAECARLMEGR